MKLAEIKGFYFVGIGGIGMSALARYFKAQEKLVAGYDKTETELTKALAEEGIQPHYSDDIQICKDFLDTNKLSLNEVLIIYTPAIPKDHKELNWWREQQANILKRSEVLGLLVKQYPTAAIAGTHGKTTTSSILAHLLHHSGRGVNAFLGGIAKNFNSNLVISVKPESLVVVEADEYDRSFLTLFPQYAIITSLDADHLDIYGSRDEMVRNYRQFATQVQEGGQLILHEHVSTELHDLKHSSYGYGKNADYRIMNVRIENRRFVFDLHTKNEKISDLSLGLPGRHNIENAVAASIVALSHGLSVEELRNGLAAYAGVKRRFDYHVQNEAITYLDDYAHHPAELEACITAVKELYPDKKITGVFQPHLFTRTRDFAEGFSKSLSLLDELILLDIYPARELPIEGVCSEMLMARITSPKKQVSKLSDALEKIKDSRPEVLLTLGAGDIDTLVCPITKWLENKNA